MFLRLTKCLLKRIDSCCIPVERFFDNISFMFVYYDISSPVRPYNILTIRNFTSPFAFAPFLFIGPINVITYRIRVIFCQVESNTELAFFAAEILLVTICPSDTKCSSNSPIKCVTCKAINFIKANSNFIFLLSNKIKNSVEFIALAFIGAFIKTRAFDYDKGFALTILFKPLVQEENATFFLFFGADSCNDDCFHKNGPTN